MGGGVGTRVKVENVREMAGGTEQEEEDEKRSAEGAEMETAQAKALAHLAQQLLLLGFELLLAKEYKFVNLLLDLTDLLGLNPSRRLDVGDDGFRVARHGLRRGRERLGVM